MSLSPLSLFSSLVNISFFCISINNMKGISISICATIQVRSCKRPSILFIRIVKPFHHRVYGERQIETAPLLVRYSLENFVWFARALWWNGKPRANRETVDFEEKIKPNGENVCARALKNKRGKNNAMDNGYLRAVTSNVDQDRCRGKSVFLRETKGGESEIEGAKEGRLRLRFTIMIDGNLSV